MTYLADRESAKKLDILSQDMGMDGMILMERAALSVAERVTEILKEDESKRKVLAICGSGNNGGDGLAAIRILSEWGYQVSAIIAGSPDKLSEQMKNQLRISENINVSFAFLDFEKAKSKIREVTNTILLDALFGVGITRDLEENFCELIEEINDAVRLPANNNYMISVDVPSGINADNGKILGGAIAANETITFGVNKLGLLLYPGKEYAGRVRVADIGFPLKAFLKVDFPAFTNTPDLREPIPKRIETGNKGTFGKVFIIAGSHGMSGAAYLSALASFKNGAGMVKIFTHERNRVILQTLLPEAIVETYEDDETSLSDETKESLKKNLTKWADVVVIGSGIGKTRRSRLILEEVLKEELPTVIDADAITLYRDYLKEVRAVFSVMEAVLPEHIIITPHVKELSEFLEMDIKEIQNDFLSLGLRWKKREDKKATLVMKDAVTLVAGSGMLYVNRTGNSAMAKAGSGDVLTGYIAAFLALGNSPFFAAQRGVFFHGLKGDKMREEFGVHSLLARDLT